MMMTMGLFCQFAWGVVLVLGRAKRSRRGADATDFASVVYFFFAAPLQLVSDDGEGGSRGTAFVSALFTFWIWLKGLVESFPDD